MIRQLSWGEGPHCQLTGVSVAQQNTTVSSPVSELRPDFTSPLARKEAEFFSPLRDGGGLKVRAVFCACDCYIGVVFRGQLFTEKLEISLPGGKAFLPL